jgi:hypothetical protein
MTITLSSSSPLECLTSQGKKKVIAFFCDLIVKIVQAKLKLEWLDNVFFGKNPPISN